MVKYEIGKTIAPEDLKMADLRRALGATASDFVPVVDGSRLGDSFRLNPTTGGRVYDLRLFRAMMMPEVGPVDLTKPILVFRPYKPDQDGHLVEERSLKMIKELERVVPVEDGLVFIGVTHSRRMAYRATTRGDVVRVRLKNFEVYPDRVIDIESGYL